MYPPNVTCIMIFSFSYGVSAAIWSTAVWSNFAFSLFHQSNVAVGWLAAANGISEVVAAVVGGLLTDTVSKFGVLRCSCICGGIACAITICGTLLENRIALFVGFALAGCSYGLGFPAMEAIFADRIETGKRTEVYHRKYALETVSNVAGFVVGIILFTSMGNDWSMSSMQYVVVSGLSLNILSFIFCFVAVRFRCDERTTTAEGKTVCTCLNETSSISSDSKKQSVQVPNGVLCCLSVSTLPYLIVVQDTIVSVGSGMTVMYFGLFMINVFHVSPVLLCCLGVASYVLASAVAVAFGQLSDRFGRLSTATVPRTVGPLMLLYMYYADCYSFGGVAWMCCAYVVRYASMNCTTGISRSVLMDTVPEEKRGRWNSLESLQNASWAGSAVVGGYIADRYGYGTTFLVTAGCHVVALCILVVAATLERRIHK